jgi:uncharacterized protein YjbI with pentapeptide repeats
MGNQAHLEMLRQGTDAWNEWRRDSPTRPSLSGEDLTGLKLIGANLSKTDLSHADLTNTDLSGCDLRGATLAEASVDGVGYDRKMNCLGARVDSCTGSPRFVRHVLESDYIESFSDEHPVLSFVWGATSCHSRSVLRPAAFALGFVISFALLYWVAPGMLRWPELQGADLAWFQSLYYSAATFTTVGASTIDPRSTAGELATLAEVILGYVWLGYLISILAQRATARF